MHLICMIKGEVTYKIYYHVKPYIPRTVQITLRKILFVLKKKMYYKTWPIDKSANVKPQNWKGWPENKKFAVLLTHDIETYYGYLKVKKLLELDKKNEFVSCFNFVPERYNVEMDMIQYVKDNGMEVGVHGLNHDGKLFLSEKIFEKRMPLINGYLKKWQSVGFYSPSTLRNLRWIHRFNIEYDSSTFDTDPFEPQPKGVKTLFPFLIENGEDENEKYVEIPYTLPQDSTLYLIMGEKTTDIWKKKIDWIVENGGMVHIRTHPDYMNFNGKNRRWEYPVEIYDEILTYIRTKYKDMYWNVLPKDMGRFWRKFHNTLN